MTYVAKVEEDENGAYIVFPDEMMEQVGWKEGDQIKWTDNGDGSYTLTKTNTKWVMVDTVLSYRMRYLVEAPADHPEYALDTVTCEEAREFSQQFIGEQIVSHRVVPIEEALKQCVIDNDYIDGRYGTPWSEQQMIDTFFTTMEDQGYDTVEHSHHYFDTERNK
jgi:bifunctional DNA-binding transcriptional regulator/antitoxin component of YhaV-PrlF toxin-antitoxin module